MVNRLLESELARPIAAALLAVFCAPSLAGAQFFRVIATPAEIEVSEGAGTIDITFSLVDCPIPSEFDIWTLYFLPGT